MKEQLGSAVQRFRKGGRGDLRSRVAELENEVQENRQLNRRVAELLDIVEELLVPIAQRDEDRIRAYLETHAADLRGPRTEDSE
jgi:hypothetical protein